MTEADPTTSLAKRLRNVQVQVRADLDFSRHVFASEPSYVIRDPITFHSHNCSAADYQILVALNGSDTLGNIFDRLVESGRLDSGQEEGFYRFVATLHQLGFLTLPIADASSLYARFTQKRNAKIKGKLKSFFLFFPVRLVNPDAFLNRTVKYAAPLFTRTALFLWLACIIMAFGIVLARWNTFQSPLGSLLATRNLLCVWVLLIVLKVIHEFGHAYACKRFGGDVPEMGAFFILFTPCAYVDASASWGFSKRSHRIIVGLAGMYFESMVAVVAVLVWSLTGPSTLHSIAHLTVIMATVVTLGFNLNPLMRYDGYYVLCDLIGIPNLRQQSIEELTYVCKRGLLGVNAAKRNHTKHLRVMLLGFAVAATIYRVVLMIAIFCIIAMKVYLIGIVVAVAYLATFVWGALRRLAVYVFRSAETAPVRMRAMVVGTLGVVVFPVALLLIPIPHSIDALGVVGNELEGPVYAESAGFLREVTVRTGQYVRADQTIAVLDNPQITTRAMDLRAQLDEEQIVARSERALAPSKAAAAFERVKHLETALAHADRDLADLDVKAPLEGQLVSESRLDDLGRFIQKGERLAIVSTGKWMVRTLVNGEELADLEPSFDQGVQLRLVGDTAATLRGHIARIAAAGSPTVEDAALTLVGGGSIAVSTETLEAEEPFFEIAIEIDDASKARIQHGMTALVSFDLASAPLWRQVYRKILQSLGKLSARQ